MSTSFDPYQQWLGIDPHERPVDHYRLLGVERFESDEAKIQAAADQRMATVHSYQTGPHAAVTQKLLNEISAAKVCLLNPATKTTYDAVLQGQLTAEPPISRHAPRTQVDKAASVSPPPPPQATEKKPDDYIPVKLPFYARSSFPLIVMIGLVIVTAAVWGGGMLLSMRSKPTDNGRQSQTEKRPPKKQPAKKTAPTIVQSDSGEVMFPMNEAKFHGDNLKLQGGNRRAVIGNWKSTDDHLSWRFHVNKPGLFRVEITYLAPETIAGGRYELAVGKSKAASNVQVGNGNEPVTDTKQLVIRRAGDHTLTLRAVHIPGDQFFELKSIRFLPR